MTKATTTLYMTLAFVIGNLNAGELPMSKQYSDCQTWPDTSSMYEGCMLNHETEHMQKEIEALQTQILQFSTKPETRKQLEKSVDAWESYLKQSCELQTQVMGGINGISSARCYNSLTKQRLSYLQNSF